MDINNLSKEDLQKLKTQINEREKSIKEQELQIQREHAKEQIKRLRKYKDFILTEILSKHNCSSCSDNDICNGLETADYGYRCTRCALMELFDEDWRDGDYEILFDVKLIKIQ